MKYKKKKRGLKYYFMRSVIITSLVVLSLGTAYALVMTSKQDIQTEIENAADNISPEKVKTEKIINKNIAIFGVDKGESRTDTILVANFNSETSHMGIMSVPRDTKVTWTEAQRERAVELGRSYQYSSKITDMSSLGGIENLRDFTISSLEEMLGIKIDHYVVVNTSLVREFVDALGGIEVDVPRRMEYTDRSQDLYIDLYPGIQILNGEEAEGLLRWRHNNSYSQQYARGDVGRIETQQLFMEAVIEKVTTPSVLTKIIPLIKILYDNIKTDVTLMEALDYTTYLKEIDLSNITMGILPGEEKKEELWYYIVNKEEVASYIQELFRMKNEMAQSLK